MLLVHHIDEGFYSKRPCTYVVIENTRCLLLLNFLFLKERVGQLEGQISLQAHRVSKYPLQ